jgi:hypothetical protein
MTRAQRDAVHQALERVSREVDRLCDVLAESGLIPDLFNMPAGSPYVPREGGLTDDQRHEARRRIAREFGNDVHRHFSNWAEEYIGNDFAHELTAIQSAMSKLEAYLVAASNGKEDSGEK